MGVLKGIFPVVAMPFHNDGRINYKDFAKVVAYLESTGAHGSILFGIASEFYKLNDYERSDLASLYLEKKNDTHKKILSVTDHSTDLAVIRAKEYEDKGADALMLLPPFFLSPPKQDLVEHISAILSSVSIPVILQYAPKETNCMFSMDEMSQLGEKYSNLTYKIESPNPMNEIKELLRLYPDANILNGYAGIHMLSVLESGGSGIIPGCSFTEIYLQIYSLFHAGKVDEACTLHKKLKQYIDVWMGSVEYIIKVEKTILKHRNIISTDYCRKPAWKEDIDIKIIEQFCKEFTL